MFAASTTGVNCKSSSLQSGFRYGSGHIRRKSGISLPLISRPCRPISNERAGARTRAARGVDPRELEPLGEIRGRVAAFRVAVLRGIRARVRADRGGGAVRRAPGVRAETL